MKRIISAMLCAALAIGAFAQKALIIHQVDGTKIEMPVDAIEGFGFAGKAVVNDNDYTRIIATTLNSDTELSIDIAAIFTPQGPNIKASYRKDFGIVYSTSPDVTVENGTRLSTSRGDFSNIEEDTLFMSLKNQKALENVDFNTTYYFRSYVKREAYSYGEYQLDEEYFYSQTVSVNTGKPKMEYYGVYINTEKYKETGYVTFTEQAMEALISRTPYLAGQNSADLLKELWNEYLTPEVIRQLIPHCTTKYDCADGMLYVLDTIDDTFAEYVKDKYDDEMVMSGYTTLYEPQTYDDPERNVVQSYVECGEEWGVPGNGYWKYEMKQERSKWRGNIVAEFPFVMLANFDYQIEVTLAPDTEQTDTLATTYEIRFHGLTEEGDTEQTTISARNAQTNMEECTVISSESLVSGGFGEANLVIRHSCPRSKCKSSHVLRIAQIKVTPIGLKED